MGVDLEKIKAASLRQSSAAVLLTQLAACLISHTELRPGFSREFVVSAVKAITESGTKAGLP